MKTVASSVSTASQVESAERRSVGKLVAGFESLADRSDGFISRSRGTGAEGRGLPRYVFLGPRGGGDVIRIAVMATIHGDEPEGALGMTRFASELVEHPELAQGYALFFYPVCNPTGFEDGTPLARSGRDLDYEFWKGSDEPAVQYLQSEIWMHAFDGIIALRSDARSTRLYGYVGGAVLSGHLIEPALREAEQFLPRNRRSMIEGLPARRGVITAGHPGSLRGVPGVQRPPFEITLETPRNAPLHRQVEAVNVALQTILLEYRYLIAIAQNI